MLHREEAEASSELKNVTGRESVHGGDMLANQSEDIKESITSFQVARISDIENERLPPDLVDAADVEGMEEFASPITSPRTSGDLSGMYSFGSSTLPNSPNAPETPGRASPIDYPSASGGGMATPNTPGTPGNFRKGHGRNSSLGTTMTSPSTRRRSLESTVSLIREAIEKSDERFVHMTCDPTSSLYATEWRI